MLVFVILCNLGLTLLNLYVIRCLWQWQRRLRYISLMLEQIEQDIHYTLSATVIQTEKSHQAVMTFNELYQQWLSYLQQFKQVIFLLGLTVNLWRNFSPKFR